MLMAQKGMHLDNWMHAYQKGMHRVGWVGPVEMRKSTFEGSNGEIRTRASVFQRNHLLN